MRARIVAFVAGVLAVASVAAVAQTSGGGFPSRPRFQSVGVGAQAPGAGRVTITAPTGVAALTVNGNTIQFNGLTGDAPRMRFSTTVGVAREYGIGTGFVSNAGEFAIFDYTATAERFRIATTGDATFTGNVTAGNITSGTFAGTLTGLTTTPATSYRWARAGNVVSLCVLGNTGTSNAATLGDTAVAPAAIRPPSTTSRQGTLVVQDNGSQQIGILQVDDAGAITYGRGVATTGWTGSGSKGIPGLWQCISYNVT